MNPQAVPDAVRRGIDACVGCGFCNATCPTYQLSGNELEGPRGRLRLMKSLTEGAELTAAVRSHLDHCLHCLACETTCPSGVAYAPVIDWARNAALPGPRRPLRSRLLRGLISRGLTVARLRQCLVAMYRLAGQIGLLSLSGLGSRRPLQKADSNPSGTAKVLIAAGCADPGFTPNTRRALRQILDHLGIAWSDEGATGCCGALDFHMGHTERALQAVNANLARWMIRADEGVEVILVPASGCGAMLKTYKDRFDGKGQGAVRALDRLPQILDPVEFLEARIDFDRCRKGRARLVFQAPCSLQHGLGLEGRVEALLSRLGYEVLKDPQAGRCCGAAGTHVLLEPAISQALKAAKCQGLNGLAADAIVTANVGCQIHLAGGTGLPVTHWLEWVEAALVPISPEA